MTYVEGFVAAVPAANKEAYRKHATDAAVLFTELGATRVVEAWGDDIPDGKITDFKRSVKAKPDEVIVFSWHEYPSKAVAEAVFEKVMSDPRMQGFGARMPFDGQRMIIGGFKPIAVDSVPGDTNYIDGSLVPVVAKRRDDYHAMATTVNTVLMEYGAVRVVDAWGDDVPDGKVTDYKGAVQAESGEEIVYSWVEWPSKQARDAGWEKVMADPRMYPDPSTVPCDDRRRVHGGFVPIVDIRAA